MAAAPPVVEHEAPARRIRLGVVSFLNTIPLIDGLDRLADLHLDHSVPSLLAAKLARKEVDLALCSSIDYQTSPVPLAMVPVGLLGCDGPTLTVRLYAEAPIERLTRVACDCDSHTSVVLMSILLAELYGVHVERIPFDARARRASAAADDWPDAVLLIGDKVVCDAPPAARYPHQVDLGAAWVKLTGLPFVFAAWMARRDADPALVVAAAAVLDRQRRQNGLALDRIIHEQIGPHRWPHDLAEVYLRDRLTYELDERRLAGLELFYDKALEHGLIDRRRPIEAFQL